MLLKAAPGIGDIRVSTYVEATSDGHQTLAMCEVFVDAIDRLEILTATRRINVKEKEKLSVQAFDKLGNVFTNIMG